MIDEIECNLSLLLYILEESLSIYDDVVRGDNALYYSYMATYFEFMKYLKNTLHVHFSFLDAYVTLFYYAHRNSIVPRGAGEGIVKFVKFDPAELWCE